MDADITTKTITIPVTRPYVAIVAPFPNTTVSGASATFRAVPYFFNTALADALLYSWTVNDNSPQANEDPDELSLSVESADTLDVSATVRNPRVSGEQAQNALDVTFAP